MKRPAAWVAFASLTFISNGLVCGQGIPNNVRETTKQVNSNVASESEQVTSAISDSVPVVLDGDAGFFSAMTGMSEPSLILIIAILIGSFLISYNVLSSGKSGWGWLTLCVAVAAIAIVAKVGVSMFCEMSTSNEIPDWDES